MINFKLKHNIVCVKWSILLFIHVNLSKSTTARNPQPCCVPIITVPINAQIHSTQQCSIHLEMLFKILSLFVEQKQGPPSESKQPSSIVQHIVNFTATCPVEPFFKVEGPSNVKLYKRGVLRSLRVSGWSPKIFFSII